jgi:hypothetical protein
MSVVDTNKKSTQNFGQVERKPETLLEVYLYGGGGSTAMSSSASQVACPHVR